MAAFRFLIPVFYLLTAGGPVLAADAAFASPQADVLDRMHAMDSDGDGMATVSEIRAFLLSADGGAAKASALADWEAVAMGGRCSSPFSGFTVGGGP
jgi:hypothetical protein